MQTVGGGFKKIQKRVFKRENKKAAQINQQKAAQIMATMPASKVSRKVANVTNVNH